MTKEEFNDLTKQWLNKEQVREMSKFLRDNGMTCYSISRLSTYTGCKANYYFTYIMGNYGGDNAYSIQGGNIHEHLENIYAGKEDVEEMKEKFPKEMELYSLFYPFPSESIGNSWKKDMLQFVKDFKKQDYYKTYQERGFIINLGDEEHPYYLQGWIDLTIEDEKGNFYIVDYKTSSLYQGEDIKEHAMQLLLYALAVKMIEGKLPLSVKWFMLKYYNVYDLKGKKKEPTPINRGKWVKEVSSKIKTHMKKLGCENEMVLNMCIQNNTLEYLPKEIQDRFVLDDCFIEYPITEETMSEMYDYITRTITDIETRDSEKSILWQPSKKDGDFFCLNLCNNYEKCRR